MNEVLNWAVNNLGDVSAVIRSLHPNMHFDTQNGRPLLSIHAEDCTTTVNHSEQFNVLQTLPNLNVNVGFSCSLVCLVVPLVQ